MSLLLGATYRVAAIQIISAFFHRLGCCCTRCAGPWSDRGQTDANWPWRRTQQQGVMIGTMGLRPARRSLVPARHAIDGCHLIIDGVTTAFVILFGLREALVVYG